MGFEYSILDADNHYTEPDDAYTRHLDPRLAERGMRIERLEDGSALNYWGGQPLYYMPRSGNRAARPGSVVDKKDRRYEPLPEEDMLPRGALPASGNREERLAWMDGQGIEVALLWPSFGLTVEYQMRSDPEACVASLAAFNRWLDEDWGFNYRGRLKGAPIVTLIDLDAAIAELDYLLAHDAAVVGLLFTPVNGRSLAHPDFDPFWARVQEAGVPVVFHASEAGYNELFSTQWGELPRPPFNAQSPFQRACFFNERPILDTLASLILHNLFGRFPQLQVMSIENGSAWVPYLLRVIDKGAISGKYGHMLGGPLTDRPSELFKRHISVAPLDDDDIRGLIDLIGADRILLGSDFPHPEGLVNPRDFLAGLDLSAVEARQIGRDNLLGLVGSQQLVRE